MNQLYNNNRDPNRIEVRIEPNIKSCLSNICGGLFISHESSEIFKIVDF